MNYKGHILFGTIFLIALLIIDMLFFNFLFQELNLKSLLLYIPVIILSFIICDIDIPSSKPRLWVTIFLLAISIYFLFYEDRAKAMTGMVILFFIWVIPCIGGFKHRGHIHSLIFVISLSVFVGFVINYTIAIIFFFGCLSHLIADRELKIW